MPRLLFLALFSDGNTQFVVASGSACSSFAEPFRVRGKGTSASNLRLAVLMNTDPEFLLRPGHRFTEPSNRGNLVVSAWNCYCLIHGYTCIYEPVRIGFLNSTGHSSLYRIKTVLKYLPFFDYVIQVALDVIPVNRSYGFEQFLHGSPDIVLSWRDSLWQGDHEFASVLYGNSSCFPKMPEKVDFAPHLHPEAMIVKNSVWGRRFVGTVLRNRNLFYGSTFDMSGVQVAALEFLPNGVHGVRHARQFEHNITRRRPSYLLEEWMGFKGPRLIGCTLIDRAQLYWHVATNVLKKRPDWLHPDGGHLRLLPDGQMLRDWRVDKLMRSGDFLVHTKKIWREDLLSIYDADCLPNADGKTFADTLHVDWFADLEQSFEIGRRYGYNLTAAFSKVGVCRVRSS